MGGRWRRDRWCGGGSLGDEEVGWWALFVYRERGDAREGGPSSLFASLAFREFFVISGHF